MESPLGIGWQVLFGWTETLPFRISLFLIHDEQADLIFAQNHLGGRNHEGNS